MSQHPFNVLDHIRLNNGSLSTNAENTCSFSGSGGGNSGPPKPHAPVKKPGKKPKKK